MDCNESGGGEALEQINAKGHDLSISRLWMENFPVSIAILVDLRNNFCL